MTIAGTSANDTFGFAAGVSHQITVNGTSYDLTASSGRTYTFNGEGGNDTITVTGTSSAETATLRNGSLTFSSTGFSVQANSTETITVDGGGGSDMALFYDSAGTDLYSAWSDRAVMSGAGFTNEAQNFTQHLRVCLIWLRSSATLRRCYG